MSKFLMKFSKFLNEHILSHEPKTISFDKRSPITIDPFVQRINAVSHFEPEKREPKTSTYQHYQGGDVIIGVPPNTHETEFYYNAVGVFHIPDSGMYKDEILGTTSAHFFDQLCCPDYSYYLYAHHVWYDVENGNYKAVFNSKLPVQRLINDKDTNNEYDIAAFTSALFYQFADDVKFDEIGGIGKVKIKPNEITSIEGGNIVGCQGLSGKASALRSIGIDINPNMFGYKNMIGGYNYFGKTIPCLFEGDCGSLYFNERNEIVASHSSTMRQFSVYNCVAHLGTPVKYIQRALGYENETPLPKLPSMDSYQANIDAEKSQKSNLYPKLFKLESPKIRAIAACDLPKDAELIYLPPNELNKFCIIHKPCLDIGIGHFLPPKQGASSKTGIYDHGFKSGTDGKVVAF